MKLPAADSGFMKPYTELFPVGSTVRVALRPDLERFLATWKFHNPLLAEQLAFAGSCATITEVGVYHGGAGLYVLDSVPGIWHEQCLTAGSPMTWLHPRSGDVLDELIQNPRRLGI